MSEALDIRQETPSDVAAIRAITKASDASGVTFVSLVPSEPVVDTAVAPTTTGLLTRIPVTITVVGGYFQVQGMLSRLEALPRAYRVTNLTVAPGAAAADADANPDDGSSLESVITGEVFMASPVPVATARAATAPGAAPADAATDTTTSVTAGSTAPTATAGT